ncbi:MAG: DNA-binding GntR family transcriptional regulator [Verrucomicrobiales bacterium]|jgi:DNA-binding GntR family transcriptional regulator
MSAELDPTTVTAPSKGRSPARRGTAHVYVRETLRQDILNGTLPGGTRLAQTDIAKQLGVSTTPVREALRDLASEGLVVIDPHRGGFVMELNKDDVFEIYEIRYHLEPIALRHAMPFINEETIDRLDQLNEEMTATSHLPTWVELNRDFHMTLYGPSNRPRLLSIIGSVQDGSVMAVAGRLAHTSGVRDEANQEHSNLVDALRVKDADRAMALLQHHLERHTHS